jgi:GTP pyrophosphokinase
MLDHELRKFGRNLKSVLKQDELRKALEELNHRNPVEIYSSIGYGRLQPSRVLPFYIDPEKLEAAKEEEQDEIQTTTLTGLFRKLGRRSGSPVRIDGQEGLLTVFAKCCRPLPGDPIMGFITRGRGITVHTSDCRQALSLPVERRVDVEWDAGQKVPHQARIHIITVDRPLMLADITKAIGKMNVSITGADIRTTKDDRGEITLDVAVSDRTQLRNLMNGLERVKGVISVDRVRMGA